MSRTPEYDYIVVGAGSAGCVIANRLSEEGARVLVLDAGRSDKSFLYRRPGALALVYEVPQLKEKADWGYYATAQPNMDNRVMPWTRGKVLGGCSSVNGMLYIRGHRDDYDAWRELGCEGWGYADVLPYFKRSEGHEDGESEFHGGSGPLKVTRPWGESPVTTAFKEAVSRTCDVPIHEDFNGAQQEGVAMYHMTCADRRRSSTSVCFLYPAVERGNVDIVDLAHATSVVIEDGRAVGVRYLRGGQEHTAYASAEVVVSAGAINSPQLLMLSGIGPADHLRQQGIDVVVDAPGVGQNLQDHLMYPFRYDVKKTATKHRSNALYFVKGLLDDLVFNKGWVGKTFIEAGAFVRSSDDQPRPDLQMFCIPWGYPEPNDDDPKAQTITNKPSFTMLMGLVLPHSVGEVRLQSANPLDHPVMDPRYFTDERDMEALVRGFHIQREVAKDAGFAGHLVREATPGPATTTDDQIRAHIRASGKTIFHPVGTVKMGVDELAPLDPQLRVKGIEGLRVADASIMPNIVAGNTNAPCIMIGEVAADLIRGRRLKPQPVEVVEAVAAE